MANRFDTHEVTNQSVPLEGHNAYASNTSLVESVNRHFGGHASAELNELGTIAGSAEALRWGREANENPPALRTHDRFGHRIDLVEYHPSYHRLMQTAIANGMHAVPWVENRPGAHVIRAAKFITWYTVEMGHCCPISMTSSILPAIRHQPDLATRLEPLLTSTSYDPSNAPLETKDGITAGMAMTEKQGGSDVRANSTVARPVGVGGPGEEYELTGH